MKSKVLNLFEYIKEKLSKNEFISVGLIIFSLILIIFLPHAIKNSLTIIYGGDFEFQQIYFYYEGYDAFWDFFRTGEIKLWSYESFLGVNYFAANTFYYLTSPFMLIMVFFPRDYLLQGIFITYILKLFTGGMLFYYLSRKYFNFSVITSLTISIAYALSGWGMYYLWFNHFADVLAITPLIFIAIEKILKEKKGLLLTISIFLLVMTNYYFSFSIIIFGSIYGLFRFAQLYSFKKDYKIILSAFLYFSLGLIVSSFVLIPSFLLVRELPRVSESNLLSDLLSHFVTFSNQGTSLKSIIELFSPDNIINFFNYLFVFQDRNIANIVTAEQTFLYPLVGLFYVPINNWDSIIFSNVGFDNAQSSMFISYSLTLILIYGIINSLITRNKRNIIIISLLLLINFTPFSYYIFNGFSQIYGRWHLLNVIVILIFAGSTIDNLKPKYYLLITSLLISAGLMYYAFDFSRSIFNVGTLNDNNSLVLNSILALIAVFTINVAFIKFKFYKYLLLFTVMVELFIASNVTINGVGYNNFKLYKHYKPNYEILDEVFDFIKQNDDGFYRIYFDVDYDSYNMPMLFDYKGVSSYHSAYSPSLNDFINDTRSAIDEDSWLINVIDKRINFETFLSIKYYIFEKEMLNIPFGLVEIAEFSYFKVYKNLNHLELGFASDKIINNEMVNYDTNYFENDIVNLHAAILNPIDFEKLKNSFKILDTKDIKNFNELDPKKVKKICQDASKVNPCHLIVQQDFGSTLRARFFNENGNLIIEDTIMLNPYNDNNFRTARGFYLDSPSQIVNFDYLDSNQNVVDAQVGTRKFYYQYYDEYLMYVDELKMNSFNDVHHSNNKISFSTNYIEDKMIVLSVPYDKGWNLRINNEIAKIFNVNNGFIGFYAPKGLNEYKLSYFTPGLGHGLFLSLLGVLGILFITFHKKTNYKLFFSKFINFLISTRKVVYTDNKNSLNGDYTKVEDEQSINV
jgi:uncharacterized membrane protein YfhO